ncbi:hypothetical protein [Blastococcus sp. TF02A-35]|uniref:hypothetical protein n=1 Tax=Blastococcus sp. TF02A-35 TaxID=2559612 RepID=UPI00107360B0|nr:hypothetical protein [Blastococcus sp. TF02A_35]TFV53306.1 hypothetical protein E4P43_01855 [Blastococcus sp. TF02A_35]
MGRHTAADGAAADPFVAAALARRSPDSGGAHRGDRSSGPDEGGLGWPEAPHAPDPGDGGLGWPGGSEQPAEDAAGPGTAEARPKRGWRRLFGVRAA